MTKINTKNTVKERLKQPLMRFLIAAFGIMMILNTIMWFLAVYSAIIPHYWINISGSILLVTTIAFYIVYLSKNRTL